VTREPAQIGRYDSAANDLETQRVIQTTLFLTMTEPMADVHLKEKISRVLKDGYFKDPNDLVDVSDGPEDSIHLVIVSRKFDGRRMKEKNDLVWSLLVRDLTPEEWGKISLSVGASPEEIKAT
jgi:stress-induced morphogen